MDERLRRLARLARAAAAVDDVVRTRLLVERVRAGDVDEARVRLAAYCGCRVARELLGPGPHAWLSEIPGGGPTVLGVDLMPEARWLAGLFAWGVGVAVRAATVVARARLPEVEDQTTFDYEEPWGEWKTACSPHEGDAVRAAERWLECPCEECGRIVLARAGYTPPATVFRAAAVALTGAANADVFASCFYEGSRALVECALIERCWRDA